MTIAKPLRHESRLDWSATEVSPQRLRVLIKCVSALSVYPTQSCIDCDSNIIESLNICNHPT